MINSLKIGDLTWRHLNNPTEEDFEFLKDRFHFHPLDIEDCKSVNQRPKIDIYDDYYFLILHFPNFDRQNKFVKIKEVKIFWGKDYIISIEKNPWGVSQLFEEYEERIQNGEEMNFRNSDILLYRILEKLMTESVYLLRKVGLDVELINRELLQEKQVKIIERISVTRKNLILINTIFKPQLRLFHLFETGKVTGFTDDVEYMEDYWGNILDYLQKVPLHDLRLDADQQDQRDDEDPDPRVDHHPAFDLHYRPLRHERQPSIPGFGYRHTLDFLGYYRIHGFGGCRVLYLFQTQENDVMGRDVRPYVSTRHIILPIISRISPHCRCAST